MAPAAEIDPRNHQFLAPGSDESPDLGQHLCSWKAARSSSRRGNHAERTSIAAPLLNLEVGTSLRASLCSGYDLGIFNKGMSKTIVCPDCSVTRVQQLCGGNQSRLGVWVGTEGQHSCNLRNQPFVAVANHGGNTIESSYFFRRALSIAASDNHFCPRIEPPSLAHKCPRIAVSLSGHATCIDNHDVGFGQGSLNQTLGAQPCADRFTVGAS